MADYEVYDEAIQRFWEESSKYILAVHCTIIGVLVALTNVPFVLVLVLKKKARTPTIINIAAANIVALLCLPLHCIHHFDYEWTLSPTMCTAYLILRDIPAAVQSFTCLMLSVVNHKKVNNRPSSSHTTSTCHTEVNISNQIPAFIQISVVWFSAIFVSVLLATSSKETCSLHLNSKLISEDISTIYLTRTRRLVFSIIPISTTLIFLLLSVFLKSIAPYRIREKNHEQYLLLGFVLLLVINNISGYIVRLSALSLYPQVTKMLTEYSLFFPTYMTAFMLPLLVCYTAPNVKRHFSTN